MIHTVTIIKGTSKNILKVEKWTEFVNGFSRALAFTFTYVFMDGRCTDRMLWDRPELCVSDHVLFLFKAGFNRAFLSLTSEVPNTGPAFSVQEAVRAKIQPIQPSNQETSNHVFPFLRP